MFFFVQFFRLGTASPASPDRTSLVKTVFFWSSPESGQKNELNLDEDLLLLLFFWSSPKTGQKNGLNLREDFFVFGLHYSQISWPPPLLWKSCVRHWKTVHCLRSIHNHSTAIWLLTIHRRVARNLKWRGCPDGSQRGSGGKAPSCRRLVVWGQSSSRRRHGGVGAEPPALEKFAFFCKKKNFSAILIKNNAFKTWHRNWQRNMI